LVCDVKNIENIFHHKYGEKTDFNGYMNKYFSSKPFEYDNKAMIVLSIEKLFSIVNNNQTKLNDTAFKIFLELLIGGNRLTLREVLKITKNNFNAFKINEKVRDSYYYCGVFTKPIAFMVESVGTTNLIKKIQKLKDDNFTLQIEFTKLTQFLVATLGNSRKDSFNYEISGKEYLIEIDTDFNNFLMVKKIESLISSKDQSVVLDAIINFSNLDFYDLLIENIKKYNVLENI